MKIGAKAIEKERARKEAAAQMRMDEAAAVKKVDEALSMTAPVEVPKAPDVVSVQSDKKLIGPLVIRLWAESMEQFKGAKPELIEVYKKWGLRYE